jgi:uncharacterized protein
MSDLDRRDFLKKALLSGAGLGALSAGGGVRKARAQDGEGDADQPHERVPRRQLGNSGQEIPILLLGCAQAFDRRYSRLLHRAYEQGVDYLDTALVYAQGQSHATINPFLTQIDNRDDIWITSKAPHRRNRADPASYSRDLDTCLEQLGTDYLNLFFMHALNDAKYVTDEYAAMGQQMKDDGRIRLFGFSCHDGNVVDLLNRAAALDGGIDAIMFRYNYRQYGDRNLNLAIDACREAGIGLIAMKTQDSVPRDQEQVVEFQSRDFTLGQAKLKAVWEDERIDAAVSHMDNMEVLEENLAAAKSRVRLSMHDFQQLQRVADCTNGLSCQGCTHLCESRIQGETKVADALRFLMYAESYGERAKARRLYQELTPAERALDGVDFSGAVAACPHSIDIPRRLEQARSLLG